MKSAGLSYVPTPRFLSIRDTGIRDAETRTLDEDQNARPST